jgi:2-C-methyl-D-erythritol 2,4-cyclodiphosphate synthase
MIMPLPIRIGFGYDVHQFSVGRKLILGGVEIRYDRGLLGHSDADVVLHALADALLGAAGLGDIGMHFPNTDMKYKDIASSEILKETVDMLSIRGYTSGNVDIAIVAEEPKLAPYIDAMRRNIALLLGIAPTEVSLKATTNEKMGFVGRGEGIAAMAVALIYRNDGTIASDNK